VNDANEDQWLRSTFGSDYLWIGLNDAAQEGVWRWSNGEAVTYTRWSPGEPNDWGGLEDYVHYWTNQNQLWNDISGSNTFRAIAEIGGPGSLAGSFVPFQGGRQEFGQVVRADINGDGVLDLVVTDKNATPQIWKGSLTANGSGYAVTFAKQTGWLSTTTCNGTTLPTNIDTVFLVPAIWDSAGAANTNLILGGVASGGGKPYVRLKKIDTDPVPPYYSACVAKGFLQIQEGVNNAALRDIFYQNSKFYLLTAYQPTTAEPNEIQLSSYTINTDGTPVFSVTKTLTSAAISAAGFAKQYKYNSTSQRCNAWQSECGRLQGRLRLSIE
jgi:hypothetical protein